MRMNGIIGTGAAAMALLSATADAAGAQLPLGETARTIVTPVSTLTVTTSATPGRLLLSWGPLIAGTPLPTFDVYQIGGVAGGATQLIATLPDGQTSFEPAMPTPGSPVQFQVIARNADRTRYPSPWVSYTPPPLAVVSRINFSEGYEYTSLLWREQAGIRYTLAKSAHPGVAAYPSINVDLPGGSVPSAGGTRSVDRDKFGGPLGTLHDTTYFQVNADNGRGEIAAGTWFPYASTHDAGVPQVQGVYWERRSPDGGRNIIGCLFLQRNQVPRNRTYAMSVLYGTNTQWSTPVDTRAPVLPYTGDYLLIATVGKTDVFDGPVRVRIHSRFVTQLDLLHYHELTLLPAAQPPTGCQTK